jgi:hypothetical protein
MLLRFGADPLARNRGGRTPRELAQEPAVFELLLQAEAEAAAKQEQEQTPATTKDMPMRREVI